MAEKQKLPPIPKINIKTNSNGSKKRLSCVTNGNEESHETYPASKDIPEPERQDTEFLESKGTTNQNLAISQFGSGGSKMTDSRGTSRKKSKIVPGKQAPPSCWSIGSQTHPLFLCICCNKWQTHPTKKCPFLGDREAAELHRNYDWTKSPVVPNFNGLNKRHKNVDKNCSNHHRDSDRSYYRDRDSDRGYLSESDNDRSNHHHHHDCSDNDQDNHDRRDSDRSKHHNRDNDRDNTLKHDHDRYDTRNRDSDRSNDHRDYDSNQSKRNHRNDPGPSDDNTRSSNRNRARTNRSRSHQIDELPEIYRSSGSIHSEV